MTETQQPSKLRNGCFRVLAGMLAILTLVMLWHTMFGEGYAEFQQLPLSEKVESIVVPSATGLIFLYFAVTGKAKGRLGKINTNKNEADI